MRRPVRKIAILLIVALFGFHAFAADRVSVAQLELRLADEKGKPDKEAAQIIGALELTERLTTARFQRLQADLPGEKSRLALLAVSDASAFLSLPAADVLSGNAPDRVTQGQIMSRAADFVGATVSRMPDFSATRTTARFQDLRITATQEEPIIVQGRGFFFVDQSTAPVLFRNGQEVVTETGGRSAGREKSTAYDSTAPAGLSNWGVFGPLLGIVMTDLLKGKMGWGHWESGASGPVAVFRYQVPQDRSTYTVRYCCLLVGSLGEKREVKEQSAYHGEIAIDPASGAVVRLVIETDLKPGLKIFRADVAVEYSAVEIGGKSYFCPVKSVSLSTAVEAITRKVSYGNGPGFVQVYREPRATSINDVIFNAYHQFRGDVRILPAGDADPNAASPTPPNP